MEKPASQPISSSHPYRNSPPTISLLIAIIVVIVLTLNPLSAHPQGCAQCQDNTAATPPKTQAAYRHAIILLTLTAGGLFLTTLALFKRHR